MIFKIIILFISLLLEQIIPNLFKGVLPFFMISTIFLLGIFYKKQKRDYILVFLSGVVYDLVCTDLVLFHGVIFVLTYHFVSVIFNKDHNILLKLLCYYATIFAYVFVMFLFYSIFSTVDYYNVLYVTVKSVILNTLYFLFIYVIFKLFNHNDKKYTY